MTLAREKPRRSVVPGLVWAIVVLLLTVAAIYLAKRVPRRCEAEPPDGLKGTVYDCARSEGEVNP